MATHPVTPGSTWIEAHPQVPNVDDTMAIATAEFEAAITNLDQNIRFLKGFAESISSTLSALSTAVPRLSGSNQFVGGTQILNNNGNSDLNVIEQKNSPHSQTGNPSNNWVSLTKSWTGVTNSGQTATVRTYTGDGLDIHKGYFAIVVNADWDTGTHRWKNQNPAIPSQAWFLTANGVFNGYKAASAIGTQWDTWNRFNKPECVNLRLATGGMLGPMSWGSDGSLKFDNQTWSVRQSQYAAVDLSSMYTRGIFVPLDIKPGEPVGTLTIRYTSAVAGDTFRLRKRSPLSGTPAYSTIASYTCVAGTLDGTMQYTASVSDTESAEYGILWTLDSGVPVGSGTPLVASSDPAFANKILSIFRSY